MRKKKKIDIVNLLAALSALFTFVMAIVIIAYFIIGKKTQLATIILFVLLGIGGVSFIVNTILYFMGSPSLKNK